MKKLHSSVLRFAPSLGLAASIMLTGCASSGNKPTSEGSATTTSAVSGPPRKVRADDGRMIELGKASPAAGGGVNFKNPHMEKCWLADGFDFNGYDTLYIAPTVSTAKIDPKNTEEQKVLEMARENLIQELVRAIESKRIFNRVVTKEGEIKPGVKTLKLENTITEFAKGGGAARYFVGLYGGGQPVLRVQGKISEGNNTVFNYEARRSGTSAGARLGGVFMKDEDIQFEDIHSLVLDLTDFMAGRAGKYSAL